MKLNFKIILSALFILGISTCLMAQNSEKTEPVSVQGIEVDHTGQSTKGVTKLYLDADTAEDVMVNLPYLAKEKYRVVGDVDFIDGSKEYNRDSRTMLNSAIVGKVAGSLGGLNINGLGNALIVIDGIPMGSENLTLQDVDQIVVLKDAISRLLYGMEADVPVIMITTKKGKANEKKLQLFAEHGVKQAISYPKFLDAASYMETYNMANRNDGANVDFYSQELIQNTRDGIDPVLYPDNDYYSSKYVKNLTNYTNVYGTVSGGNDKTQYMLSLDWTNTPGWNQIQNTVNNKLRVRGRVDFTINNWLKMNSQVLASYNISKGPRIGNYWTKANSLLPNAFPELIPISRISNLETLPNYSTVNEAFLLGGTSIYQNTMHGDLLRNGSQSLMQRYVQSLIGYHVDLKRITTGLSAHGAVSFDFYNVFQQMINNTYSVYEPGSVNVDNNFPVTQIGVDKVTTKQTINNNAGVVNQSVKWNYTLNYDRTFDEHRISAVGLGYGSYYNENDLVQAPRKLAFGGQASYMLSDKYIIEGALLGQSSMKVKPSKRYGFSKSTGAAWIISEEDFLNGNSLINYLKLRASYGQFVSDPFTNGPYLGYFLNEDIFANSYIFTYNNGLISNRSIKLENIDNHIDWERRNELSVGMDMSTFNNQLKFNITFTNSYSFDNVTNMGAIKPNTLGAIIPFSNYNATNYQTLNIGLKLNKKLGDFHLGLGAYYTLSVAKIKKIAETQYVEPENKHLSKVNKDARAMWGLIAERLFLDTDFATDGTLNDDIPTPTWGDVKPGDIKYLDYNKDGVINDDDQTIIGRNSNNNFLSFNIGLIYKQWELFLLPIMSWGGQDYKNSEYYWFKGNEAKYSIEALHSYSPENPDAYSVYPRLSLGSSSNNYRNSTFWLYERAQFGIESTQLSYQLLFKDNPDAFRMKLYCRGTNILMLAKDREVLELNFGSAPQSRIFSIGAIVTF
ncbi:hypothetical protein [Proteiniphilum sp. UBA5384]|uniref:hypothetical protein n=1 Tax=Proteiniphilum sp. UBA5384 TaxID=1947279 RepID=UPI0025CC9E6E|nr:hypothetical protein [Proteiniphilum sp. UBA5384]